MRSWPWCRSWTAWFRLCLNRPDINATTEYAIEANAALVAQRRRSKARITRLDRGTTGQRQMRERRTAVILQRTKQRIGIDLIAGTNQKTAAVIAADVVSIGRNRAAVVNDVFSRDAGVEDRISSFKCPTELPSQIVDATAGGGRVPAERAVSYLYPSSVVNDGAARISSRVAADCAVDDSHAPIVIRDSATRTGRRVAADCAVDHCDTRGGFECPTANTATIVALACRVTAHRAIEDGQKTVIQDA